MRLHYDFRLDGSTSMGSSLTRGICAQQHPPCEVAEGGVGVVFAAQGLPDGSLVRLLAGEGEGRGGGRVLDGLLVVLLRDDHVLELGVLAAGGGGLTLPVVEMGVQGVCVGLV